MSEKQPLLPEPASHRPPPRAPSVRARALGLTLLALQTIGLVTVISFIPGSHLSVPTVTIPLSSLWTFRAPSVLRESDLDVWIREQDARSLQGVLANVGPTGEYSGPEGAKKGIVVASPTTTDPNYVYTWTRDAALVTKALLEHSVATGNSSILEILKDYASAQDVIQHVQNPSGTFDTGGLGEPKFNVDYTAFLENWGRPQLDGPALRSTTLMSYATHLLSEGQGDYVRSTLVPMIKADLDFVAKHWNETGFDLWEEVKGSSFFTTAVQHRALVEGAAFFEHLGTPNPTYQETSTDVLCFLQDYWSHDGGYVVSNINDHAGRGGIDGNSILASIHTFDADSTSCDAATFQPCSDKALANHKVVVDSFRNIYSVNKGISASSAVALGRYPEDVYYSGNPWYLITLAAAEQLYDALYTWERAGEIEVTPISLSFFQALYPAASVGRYMGTSNAYRDIVEAVRNYADDFTIVRDFTPNDGSFAEQFDRNTGAPLSAKDLTWSYASFLTANSARSGKMPAGWASPKGPLSCPLPELILVTFEESVKTVYGEFVRKTSDGHVIWESGPNRCFTTEECAICFAPISEGNLVRMPTGQPWDAECLRKLFDLAMKDESMYPPRDHDLPIALDFAIPHLRSDEIAAYRRKEEEYAVPASLRIYCSNGKCSHFIVKKTLGTEHELTCRACGELTCSKCRKRGHGFGFCDNEEDDIVAAMLVKKHRWKRCPKCQAVVEKNGGCGTIYCRCGRAFSYY
ncbi:glucoamylase/glucan 1,4-alpha-glucosidase-like protein [Pseudohyphozyma bogoriensis]|nr:glucoamylase/glucan 1,4-alpha-glucosidase-like protein [Pseudohyphozyma bogoriensis]